MRNDGAQIFDVSELIFIREDGTSELSAEANLIQRLPAGACIVITSQNLAGDTPNEWGCDEVTNLIKIPADALFWRQTAASTLFEVRLGESHLFDCPGLLRGGEDTCELIWPAVEESEG